MNHVAPSCKSYQKVKNVLGSDGKGVYQGKIYVKDINLLSSVEKCNDNLFIKVRSTGRLIRAKITLNKSEAEVNLNEDEAGISPGQACVFYLKNKSGDKVLGGGWIARTVNKYLST